MHNSLLSHRTEWFDQLGCAANDNASPPNYSVSLISHAASEERFANESEMPATVVSINSDAFVFTKKRSSKPYY